MEARRCLQCRAARSLLRTHSAREKLASTSRFARNSYLATPQRKGKFLQLAKKSRAQSQTVRRLRLKIKKWAESHAIEVQKDLSDEVQAIVKEQSSNIESTSKEGTFQRLFWDQQKEMSTRKGCTGRRWHPLMIRLAMSLKTQSSSAYHMLRTSGFVIMPSERTLNDYIHFYRARTGFHDDLDLELAARAKVKQLTFTEKHVALSFDEMRIREDLVYDKSLSKIVGFTDLGDVNSELQKFASCDKEQLSYRPPIATHMFVFMIRGITTKFRFPYAHFPTTEITSSYLHHLVWEAIRRIESLGLKVLSVTCDGAAEQQ